MSADVKQIIAERDAFHSELMELKKKHRQLEEVHATLQTAHQQYVNKFGQMAKPYEPKEGDSKCSPVALHGVCPICHWTRDTQMKPGDKRREPHPII